ncbi:hypothetical protein AGMMS49521_2900 [Campylobacterota bacterium]|nr:hypothetical protein AGMMS49521_2900 [Campylobacterota bacterium]
MQLQSKLEVNAAAETLWQYYAEASKRKVWEDDLESLVFDGEVKTGTTGTMKLAGMPKMKFVLTEVIEYASYCDRTDVPNMGSLFFEHKIVQENGRTYIVHSVRLEKEGFSEADLGFLSGVFADVPASMFKIKRAAER